MAVARLRHAAAALGVELIRAGEGALLMKGSLHTDELMHEVTSSTTGLRTGRRIRPTPASTSQPCKVWGKGGSPDKSAAPSASAATMARRGPIRATSNPAVVPNTSPTMPTTDTISPSATGPARG